MSSVNNNIIASPFAKGRQHQFKFQSILSEAAKLFNWQGSRATTLEDIAGSMKLTKTCVYYYVKTKEDLIYQCYVSSCEMWLAKAQQANSLDANGLEKIVAMVRDHFDQYIDTLNGKARSYAMLTEISSLNDVHAADILRRWREIFSVVETMVKHGITEGVIEPLDSSIICVGIFSIPQWFPVWLKRPYTSDAAQTIDAVLELLVNGLAADRHEFSHIDFPPMTKQALDSFDHEVQNRVIQTGTEYTEAQLREAANFINQSFVGQDVMQVRRRLIESMQNDRDSMNSLMATALEIAEQSLPSEEGEPADYVLAGQENLFDLGHENTTSDLRALFQAFSTKSDILDLLDRSLETKGIQLFIGQESGYQILDECSVVTSAYRIGGKQVGVLGVVGPTRMPYDRIIPAVDVTARLLSAALGGVRSRQSS